LFIAIFKIKAVKKEVNVRFIRETKIGRSKKEKKNKGQSWRNGKLLFKIQIKGESLKAKR